VAGRFDYFPKDDDDDDRSLVAMAGTGGGGGRRALALVGIGFGAFALAGVIGIAGWAMLRPSGEHSLPPNGPESAV